MRIIEQTMTRYGYKHISLKLETVGKYLPTDSEWNYSDTMHAELIHKMLDCTQVNISNKDLSTFMIQMIGPFAFPAITLMKHDEPHIHEYTTLIMGRVVTITSEHLDGPEPGTARTVTSYKFYYRNVLSKQIARISRFLIQKNYKIVMDEDRPLREHRGLLRHMGLFYTSDLQETHGFLASRSIAEDHVSIGTYSMPKDQYLDIYKTGNYFSFDAKDNVQSRDICTLFLELSLVGKELLVFPSICPHEGAPLCRDGKTSREERKCSWHPRVLKPYTRIALSDSAYIFNQQVKFQHLNRAMSLTIEALDGDSTEWKVARVTFS